MKLFSMFSGYGGAEFALQKAGIEFETVGYSEIDKYAIQCYDQNHRNIEKNFIKYSDDPDIHPDMYDGEDSGSYGDDLAVPIKNYGDATKINEKELPDFDLLTGGFPCQSFSVAGKGKGELDTRGTLFWDILRIAKEKMPKYMLLENVKGITNKNHKATFDKILSDLDDAGYDVDWQVLNSKEYGIPQNRQRVWFVCRRKDLKQEFEFPEKVELDIFLKDILEDEVDKKYYLSEKQMSKISLGDIEVHETQNRILKTTYGKHQQDCVYDVNGVIGSIPAGTHGSTPYLCKIIQINNPKHSNDRVYDTKGISPTLNTMQGGNRQPFITSETRIRKLTPKECFRLMGFLDDEINLEGLSNTQRYKLAGNGWEINVASKILKNLIK